MRKLAVLAVAAAVLVLIFFCVLPPGFDLIANRITHAGEHAVSAPARALFAQAEVVDLHADTLLWGRDLLSRSARGAVDVPRLLEGNVALQAFTIVSTTPRFMKLRHNDDSGDDVTLLALAQRWPQAARHSPYQRALYQAQRLRDFAAGSGGRLTLITSKSGLDTYLAQRARTPRITAGLLGAEGAQPLEGDLGKLDPLYDAGIRMMAPTHFTDTAIASSAHGMLDAGLTPLGRAWVQRMEQKHMLIDLAHASHGTIHDVLALATRPLVDSHTGVRGTCDNDRNLTDDELRGIARTGGVIGIAYFKLAVCDPTPAGIAKAMRYAADVAGVEHVGLGSDFDGAVRVPFDSAHLIQLVDPLLAEGFTAAQIKLILGDNTLRVLRAVLE